MTEFRSDMGVELIDHMGSDQRIADAARVSTSAAAGKPGDGLVRKLIQSDPPHTSPFEHCVLTVRVEIPKRVAWEWTRHRTQSYSELSTRYAEMDPVFYTPPKDRPIMQVGKPMDYTRRVADPETYRRVTRDRIALAEYAMGLYREQLDQGVAREVAAEVFPSYFYTAFYATANLHNWFKFLYLRTDPTALWEIQEAGAKVEAIIAKLWPVAYDAWKDGIEERRRAREAAPAEPKVDQVTELTLIPGGAS